MSLYYYLFYKIYRFTKKIGDWEVAESAMFILSILLGLNFNIILFILFPLTESFLNENKLLVYSSYVSIIIFNYYLFLRKKKYLEIEQHFKKESKTQKLVGDIVVSLYVIFTISFTLFLPRFL